ncbi:hypothetical protein GE061_017105 [Apolygus lucorum]|uniref:Uncharacterized protein n=1 Tax=Apolygus lucorum TaxID=248454 RepID=A0A8S9XI46_APOLU|nr:hypothetical protein GE061_017105 [Apolygus lucorum]
MSSPLGPAFSPITPSGDRPATPGTVSPNQTKPAKTTRPRSATPPSRSESPKSDGEEDAEWFPEPCPEPQRLLSDASSIATQHSLMVRLTRKLKKRTLACLHSTLFNLHSVSLYFLVEFLYIKLTQINLFDRLLQK